MKKSAEIKKIIKESYGKMAKSASSCGCGSCGCNSNQTIQKQSGQMGYSPDEMNQAPAGANLGLGCGNPVAIASLKEGEVVLDLGSGAGFDAFLASSKVGRAGKVIGVDMTEEMLAKAKENARKGGYTNVEFRQGDIEDLPAEDRSVDVIISNCVINLAPNKEKVFKEAYRVLKAGGRLMASDIVLLKPLPAALKKDEELLVGCVSGAILKQDYLQLLAKAGFAKITVHKEVPAFLPDYGLSMTFSAVKPTGCCEPFDPKPWQEKKIVWKNKIFVFDHITSFLHIPLNMGPKIIKNMALIEKAKAKVYGKNYVVLFAQIN